MMHREDVIKLLREIDHIEADMRSLEHRMTNVRSKLWQSIGGERSSGVIMDGRTPREVANAEAFAKSVEF